QQSLFKITYFTSVFNYTYEGGRKMADTNGSGSIVLLDVVGSDKVSQAFKDKVVQIASDLGTNPNFLMAVMSFESGGTFSPSIKNAAGSGAVGLIQFMPPTAKGLGTSTAAL